MDVEITRLDGTSFRLSDYDVIVRDFIVGSVPVTGIYGTIEGRAGTVDYGADLGQRQITVPFYTEARDHSDYALLRDELFSLVVTRESFYVRELRRREYGKGNDKFIGGKRYLVRLSGEFSLEQTFRYGFGELALETTDLPYAESIGTSMDIHRNGINAVDEIWGFGMGVLVEDDALMYSHNAVAGQSFRIYNPGTEAVHPFEHDFKLTISDVVGSTDSFRIRNLSNESQSRITTQVRPTDVIVYDGPNITRNSLALLRDTDMNYISLDPGWNEFRIYNCDSATVEFDFRFYYV